MCMYIFVPFNHDVNGFNRFRSLKIKSEIYDINAWCNNKITDKLYK